MLNIPQLAYISAISASGISIGAQFVILPWLGVAILGLSASELGVLQAAKLSPLLLLLLIGGALSDHRNNRLWLSSLYFFLLIPQFGLAWLMANEQLSFLFLSLYGFSMGAILAFIQPARERILPSVAGGNLQQWVVAMTGLQFAAQIIGFLFAGQMESWNLVGLLLGQAALFVLCGVLIRFTPEGKVSQKRPSIREAIQQGFNIVNAQPVLKQLMILVAFNGAMNMGLFSVVMPILVHRSLEESASFYAYIQLAFAVGTVAVTLFLLLRKMLRNKRVLQPGRLVAMAVFGSGLLMLSIATGLSPERLLVQVLIWGALSGVSMVMGRAVVQELAGDQHRARVMSIYQLALFGSAPFGALLTGYLVDAMGLLDVLRGAGWLTLFVFMLTLFASSLWQFESAEESSL